MPGINQNYPVVQAGTSGVTTLNGLERVAADSLLSSGAAPETVAATSWQLGAMGLAAIYNSGTLSSNTATVNAASGIILTGSLSTAAGSTYDFTIVNSLATTGAAFQLVALHGAATAGIPMIQTATIANSGTLSVTLKNAGTAAFNGTMLVPFQVGNRV